MGRGRSAEGEAGRVKPPTGDPLQDTPPKPKRGRKTVEAKKIEEKLAAEKAYADRELQSKELALLAVEAVSLPFSLLAKRRGAHWALTSTEEHDVSLAISRVVVKYLPALLLRYKEEAGLLLVGIAIMVPRLKRDSELAAAVKAAKAGSATVRDHGTSGIGEDNPSPELAATLA